MENKKITVDDIYVSPLKAKMLTNAEGWMRMEPVNPTPPQTDSPFMNEVARLLARDCGTTPQQIAREAKIKPKIAYALFQYQTGEPIDLFLKQYRLKTAREWLACTDLPISEVAKRSGFTSHGTFSRTFLEATGVSPTKYRKAHRPENYKIMYKWE